MKSIFKKLRRFSAGLFALMMTAGLVFGAPGLAVTSYAAQELEDANLPINGGSSTTAWLWKHHTPHTPNNFGQITTFEIEGITDPSRIGHPTPYVGKNFNAGGLQGTYNQAGFSTLIQVGTGPLTAYNVNAKNGGVFTSSAIGNLEMQVKSYPSNDNKWMIVEYILYNNSATPVTDVYFGSTADVMIANDDYAPLERKANTVVMRNNQVNAGSNGSGSTPNPHRGAVFELVVNNSLLGIHNVYKEGTYAGAGGDFRNYLGYWSNRVQAMFSHGASPDGSNTPSPIVTKNSYSGQDSGINYSWQVNFGPYQRIVKKVALGTKGPSLYVSDQNGNDSTGTGAPDSPLKTIEGAIARLNTANAAIGYIYIQDYRPITATIPIDRNITISSADYDFGNNNVDLSDPANIKTLERGPGLDAPIFTVTAANHAIDLTNIIVDGGKAANDDGGALINATGGKVVLNFGSVLQNAKTKAAGQGSALNVTGSASLEMNYGTVRQNEGTDRGAINFSSSGTFTVNKVATVTGNTGIKPSGSDPSVGTTIDGNVFLASGKVITVAGDLNDGTEGASIGVTTEAVPTVSVGGATRPTDEVVIAQTGSTYPAYTGNNAPFVDNFTLDNQADLRYIKAAGTQGTSNGGWNNLKKVVITKSGFQLSYAIEDTNGAAIPSTIPPATTVHAQSDNLGTINPPAAPAGWTLDEVVIEQPSPGSIIAEPKLSGGNPNPNFGKISGTMPNQDVVVRYRYARNTSRILFDTNGGLPATVLPWEGNEGAPITGFMPIVSKYGYSFVKWSATNSPSGAPISGPAQMGGGTGLYQAADETYYAIFTPDTSVKYDYVVTHNAISGRLFHGYAERQLDGSGRHVEQPITGATEEKLSIPGYVWDKAASSIDPANYVFTSADNVIGRFYEAPADPAHTDGKFIGKMPGVGLNVNFKYGVDPSHPGFEFKVEYKRANGAVVAPPVTSMVRPEEAIAANPPSGLPSNLELARVEVRKGGAENPFAYVYALDSDLLVAYPEGGVLAPFRLKDSLGGSLSTTMPNQDVHLVYIYRVAGTGNELSVRFRDMGTTDENLRDIIEVWYDDELYRQDDPIEYPKASGTPGLAFYGYNLITSGADAPSESPANANADFDALQGYKYVGTMDDSALRLTYSYSRDLSKWANVEYYPGAFATLSATPGVVSSDVIPAGGGGYTAKALADDGSGSAAAYTFADMKSRNLVPEVNIADDHYLADGWIIDANGNGTADPGEPAITDAYRFTTAASPVKLIVNVKKNPARWFDIHFKAGAHTTPVNGIDPVTVNVRDDATWGDWAPSGVTLPAYTIEVNYLERGWFDGARKMEAGHALNRDRTYTYQARKDPAIFGLDLGTKDAAGSLLPNGKGRITVYDTSPEYKYIITDMNGTIVAVDNGNVSGRTFFDGMYPGTRYKVYEAIDDAIVNVGSDISSVPSGERGIPSEVLVPVLDKNYTIAFDENNDGKTSLTINPADPDSDYSILELDGTLGPSPELGPDGWTTPVGTNPAIVTFTNLEYNREYIVVARKRGDSSVTPISKMPDGSNVIMDPDGEIEIPQFTVETVFGDIASVVRNGAAIFGGAAEFREAHAGDTVSVTAPQVRGTRVFSHWEVTIGSISGISGPITTRDFSFTMPSSNIVMSAIYKRAQGATPSVADVIDEVRGGSANEIALDPSEVEGLENALTIAKDRELMDINRADVLYKVVYKKGSVRATESDAIKTAFADYSQHPTSYTAAWGLDVFIERYVNGRRVGYNDGTTDWPNDFTGSFKTYIQLDREDVDMMEYRLLQVDAHGNFTEVALSRDPEESGGLFSFTAEPHGRYLLVYNKAFRVSFVNKFVDRYPEALRPGYTSLYRVKVRKGEAPADYAAYQTMPAPLNMFTDADTGITYRVMDLSNPNSWSYRETAWMPFDPYRVITRRQNVYAFYQDDSAEIKDRSDSLEGLLSKLIARGDDLFLKQREYKDIQGAIKTLRTLVERPGLLGLPVDVRNDILAAIIASPMTTPDAIQAIIDQKAAEHGIPVHDLRMTKPTLSQLEAILAYPIASAPGLPGGSNAGVPGVAGNTLNLGQTLRIYDSALDARHIIYDHISSGRSSGGTRSSGGGSGSGSSSTPFRSTPTKNYTVGTNGRWELIDASTHKWAFVLNGGIRLTSTWGKLDYANDDVNKNGWYHFNSRGLMDIGWFKDEKGDWYYCNTERDGWLGKMKMGWHLDETDKSWYYLDAQTGKMATGWTLIDGKWYYFAEYNAGDTYGYDAKEENWYYFNNGKRPLGSMYRGEKTPDGYQVDQNGAWIQ